MPRKPNLTTIKTVVVVNRKSVKVSLYPPKAPRTSWFAYWPGLRAAKSTGQPTAEGAREAVVGMLSNNGQLARANDLLLTDEEFEKIQRNHFSKKLASGARARAEKSLKSCLEAIRAFRDITGLMPVSVATPDDCEAFQKKAIQLPRNWRQKYPKGKTDVEPLQPNTITKWSRELQAAFERANVNGGKKCVRGVVDPSKLLSANPWRQFTWIEGGEPKKRRFSSTELAALLTYLESQWPEVTAAAMYVKISLWVWGRRSEVAGLRWENLREIEGEYHFDFIGKWGVRKWARIPLGLHQDLLRIKADSPYVFAAYNQQIRAYHQKDAKRGTAKIVAAEYHPALLYEWFAKRVIDWTVAEKRPHATHHAFRRTALQAARRGEDRNERVAQDAHVSSSVMMDHYVDETDEELRQASNRMYYRLLAGLPPDVSKAYGYVQEHEPRDLETQLRAAVAAKDWPLAERLASELAGHRKHRGRGRAATQGPSSKNGHATNADAQSGTVL